MFIRTCRSPRLGVVIPIFGHSSLLIEAIESVLTQKADFAIRVILVNDGCRFPETDEVCRDYAAAFPDQITYLRKPNGGLSDARNFGIRHILAALPSVEAVYLLDADNRLRRGALARSMAELDEHPDADWVYPNIDMFGTQQAWDYGGDYSLLLHSTMNLCEAGSLIRRRVFEAGIMFDAQFKLGWEDWDFFLCAARAGFRGRNLEDFGFLYRKRPESMLADSARDHPVIEAAMRLKHKELMQPDALMALEQTECPRYAIVAPDRGEVLYTVDPLADQVRRLTVTEFAADIWRSVIIPGRYHTPPFLVVMASDVMDGLRTAGVLHWALWKIEDMHRHAPITVLNIGRAGPERMGVVHSARETNRGAAVALSIGSKLLKEVLTDGSTYWIDTLSQPTCDPPVAGIELKLPAAFDASEKLTRPTAVLDFLSLVHRLRASPFRAAASDISWDWRKPGIAPRAATQEIVRRSFRGAAAFPRLRDGDGHVGFILPLIEFGGVEKVALNMARGLRAYGWVPHAFVLEAQDIAVSLEWRNTFESTNFLAESDFKVWGGGEFSFFGTTLPRSTTEAPHGTAVGMLHWLDVAISFQGGAVAGIMGQLRRLGATTVLSLHLSDHSAFGRPEGNTYLGLAFEHAFDIFAPCSHKLADWCHAMGVPRAKIVTVQNAPGFEVPTEFLARTQGARDSRRSSDPLRVLYLGRLDRQKGLERLAAVIAGTKRTKLNVEWRVIGTAVVSDKNQPLPAEIKAILEPPITDSDALSKVLAWADVLVLLSSYEGLPLTILEAMRAGVVPVATDVGAVSEVVRDGENGVLLPLQNAVTGCLDAITTFAKNRRLLRRLSARAFAERQGYNWTIAIEELAERLANKDVSRLAERSLSSFAATSPPPI